MGQTSKKTRTMCHRNGNACVKHLVPLYYGLSCTLVDILDYFRFFCFFFQQIFTTIFRLEIIFSGFGTRKIYVFFIAQMIYGNFNKTKKCFLLSEDSIKHDCFSVKNKSLLRVIKYNL